VIDDASVDNGPQIVQSFTDTRIRLLRQENNMGVSAARNRGIDEARYEWIAFLDADDEWKNDFLETILELMIKYPDCAACATSYEYIYERTGRVARPLINNVDPGWSGSIEDYFSANADAQIFCTDSIVVKRSALYDVGGFPIGMPRGQDTFVWVNLFMKHKLAFINLSKAIYHLGVENQSTSRKSDHKVLYWLLDLWDSGKITEKHKQGYKKYITRHLYVAIRRALLLHQDGEMARKFLRIIQDRNFDDNRKKIYMYILWSFIPRIFSVLVQIKEKMKLSWS
jgi:glycosyltransferase involved in cell wall biosynthesis